MPSPGDQIGGYGLLRRLSTSRRAEVWLAERHVGGHQVAVKLMSSALSLRPSSEAKVDQTFQDRLEAARRLQHPSTVRVLGGGREATTFYIVSEFVSGVDLGVILEHARKSSLWPSLALSLHVARHVAASLSEAHASGLLHGRLSPSRILVARNGEVKVTGYVSTPAAHEEIDTLGGTSASHEVAYLSPELARDSEATDARSDVFALGSLLCELVTRQAPFRRTNDLETLAAISQARLPELPASLDPELRRILERALAKRPEERFRDASDFLSAVDAISAPPVDEAELLALTQIPDASDTAAPWEVGEPIEDTLAAGTLATPSELEPQKRRFEIIRRVGEGGMGEVYRARDRELDEIVALKVMSRELAADAQLLERMRREVRLARRISSERVCRIHDLVELEDGARGISMQFVEGQTLASLIKDGVPVHYARFAAWGADIAEGLAAAHALSVVHRDLKPENVMIDAKDRAVILDFGIAASSDPGSADKLTKQGVILGTLPYMAPEQLTASPVDGRADIYALGLILAELVTGEVPFSAPDYTGLLERRVVHPERYDLRRIDPATPKDLAEAVNRMLMSNPADRPADAMDVARALRAVAHEAATRPERTSALEHPTPLPDAPTEPRPLASTAALPLEHETAEPEALPEELPTEPPRPSAWSVLALGVAAVLLGVGLVVLGQALERGSSAEDEAAATVDTAPRIEPMPGAAPADAGGAEMPPPEPPKAPTEKPKKRPKDWLPPVEEM